MSHASRHASFAAVSLLCIGGVALAAQEPRTAKVEAAERELARSIALSQAGELGQAQAAIEAAWAPLDEPIDGAERDQLLARLGVAARRCGAARVAHDVWSRVLAYRTRTLDEDHVEVQRARGNLALAKEALGDEKGALALLESVHAVFLRTLSPDDLLLQTARQNLADVRAQLGDLDGAIELQQKACEALERTLPQDDPYLLGLLNNLAISRSRLGDDGGAHDIFARILEIRRRTLPDEHLDVQEARANLAAMKNALGDLAGARRLLERVVEVFERTLPDDHPLLLRAYGSLAITRSEIGDRTGARELLERVYAVRKQSLPDDHSDLTTVRMNLAVLRRDLGDLQGARELAEQAYEALRGLPDDHPDLQTARSGLASSKEELGDLTGALELEERIRSSRERTLPERHVGVQSARFNVALLRERLGELEEALELHAGVYAVRSEILPADHPSLQDSRRALAWLHAESGNAQRAAELAVETGRVARQRLAGCTLSPREAGETAVLERPSLGLLLSLARDNGAIPAQDLLLDDALLLCQALRGVETRAARVLRRARAVDAAAAAGLEADLRVATAAVSRTDGGVAEQLARVTNKERVQRALADLAARAGSVLDSDITVERLAAALPQRSAAAAIVGYDFQSRREDRRVVEARVDALVLDRRGGVRCVPLGATAELEPLVEALRSTIGGTDARGRPAAVAAADAAGARRRLGQAVLAPVLGACGPIETLFVTVDDTLELTPLDALPLAGDLPVGERVSVRPLVSLFELLENPAGPGADTPGLLIAGGIDYARISEAAAATIVAGASAPVLQRSQDGDEWTPLPGTAREATQIADLFRRAFADGRSVPLTGEQASKARILAAAPEATFVHLATHGYFAAESTLSIADRADAASIGATRTRNGLSPLVLCGLALSGAGLATDELGRHAGIVTAEEILGLDLSRCQLVTLSACDTSLGLRRAGQGYASLRAALQAAGARFVLTSLWKVGDEATTELMVDFYRRLWEHEEDPHKALWEAKMVARKKGMPFRDWAGWVLTGH